MSSDYDHCFITTLNNQDSEVKYTSMIDLRFSSASFSHRFCIAANVLIALSQLCFDRKLRWCSTLINGSLNTARFRQEMQMWHRWKKLFVPSMTVEPEFRQHSWELQVPDCCFTKRNCEFWKLVCVCFASEGLVIYRLQPGSSWPPSGWVAPRNWVPPERLFWKVGYLPALIPQGNGRGGGRGQAPEGWSPCLPAKRHCGKSHLGTQLWKSWLTCDT